MEKIYFYDVAVEQSATEYINQLNENKILIISPTSMKKIKINTKNIKIKNWHDISKDINKIEDYCKKLEGKADEIVAFGGGSAIDIGKYIAYKLKIKFTCIPSMLSTNTYATDKVALIKDSKKITINAKLPNKIIIDNELLKLSKKQNLYGLADVLSIYTALYDWELSNKDINEYIDTKIYIKAERLLNQVMDFTRTESYKEIISNNIKLFKYIGEAGYITNLYGSGRPESGSEHILAKEIERKIDIPHGMSVAVGILIMSAMQDRYSSEIEAIIRKMKIFEYYKEYGLTKEVIKTSLNNVKPREDRYTIINRNAKNKEQKEKIIDNVVKIIREE